MPPLGVAIAVLLVGAALHLGRLTAWPSPAGDEMNWFDMASDAHAGRTPEMAEAASFASTLFARIVSLGFYVGEIDWWHARIGVAVLTLVLAAAADALLASSGRRTAGAVMLAWQLLSPWSLAWSRTASQPYAIMSGLGALGTILWWLALSEATPRRRAALLLASAQVFAVDLFRSPFAVAPIAAAELALVVHHRRRENMRWPWPWVALAMIFAETIPVARAASKVAGLHAYTFAQITADLGPRSVSFVRALLDGTDGAATILHFAWGRCQAPVATTAVFVAGRVLTVMLAVFLVWAVARKKARSDEWSLPAAAGFVASAIATPILLAPARDWAMPTIDSDRYAFAWVMPSGSSSRYAQSRRAVRQGSRAAHSSRGS